jgi:hypothetical protein
MPQVANQLCGVCHERIPSLLEGRFCETCGSAVHYDCASIATDRRPKSRCLGCNAELAFVEAQRAENPEFRRAEARAAATEPLRAFNPYRTLRAWRWYGAGIILVIFGLLIPFTPALRTYPREVTGPDLAMGGVLVLLGVLSFLMGRMLYRSYGRVFLR